jgi:hypothetical protein
VIGATACGLLLATVLPATAAAIAQPVMWGVSLLILLQLGPFVSGLARDEYQFRDTSPTARPWTTKSSSRALAEAMQSKGSARIVTGPLRGSAQHPDVGRFTLPSPNASRNCSARRCTTPRSWGGIGNGDSTHGAARATARARSKAR